MSREQYGDSLDLDIYRGAVNDARKDLGMDADHRSDESERENTAQNQSESDDASTDQYKDGDGEKVSVDEAEIAASVANAKFEQ